jgi:hypothetical protein
MENHPILNRHYVSSVWVKRAFVAGLLAGAVLVQFLEVMSQ